MEMVRRQAQLKKEGRFFLPGRNSSLLDDGDDDDDDEIGCIGGSFVGGRWGVSGSCGATGRYWSAVNRLIASEGGNRVSVHNVKVSIYRWRCPRSAPAVSHR